MPTCFNIELRDTKSLMNSGDYKKRFVAEYWQTKIRYEKLKAFNNKIEAANLTSCVESGIKKLEMPKHDCPHSLLVEQQHHMGMYLHVLEVRAEIEGIDLDGVMLDYLTADVSSDIELNSTIGKSILKERGKQN